MTVRRVEFTVALCAVAAGAGTLAGASGRTWARAQVNVGGPVAAAPVELTGDDLAPTAFAMGLAGLAALAAVLATRGPVRRALGGVVALFGLAALVGVWRGTRAASLQEAAADRATAGGAVDNLHLLAQWPALAAAGALLLAAAGACTLVRGAAWPAMGGRYDRHSAPGAARSSDPAELWKSLDTGADPTVDPGSAEEPGAAAVSGRTDHENPKEP
ncbi:Trp biosynthesis-associated membrane protein [Streptomonospora wellingtoniae]|uniref:Trp biosynthesis-associated membrane protein n=1 Tax=Streptomonospora wellingtoniae TaxID=3075544 RepID=A0ABU2KVW1_9ACTN|nr:Trp biosynthesis-associated membrane protein [Streptomonospora sp. DSM 45055]MDT0303390.1 Trp biosynthesis-associated membrane protein [Streptomonospora sp. DSM 45055]